MLALPHAAATRGHVPLMGLSHDQAVCCEGLPDLPAALQEYGRPAAIMPGRFAPARRPDQCKGQLGSYPSCLTLCNGVCPKAGTQRCMPFAACDLERDARLSRRMISEMHAFHGVCVCPKAGTQRDACLSRHVISGRVCMPEGRDTELHAFRGMTPQMRIAILNLILIF